MLCLSFRRQNGISPLIEYEKIGIDKRHDNEVGIGECGYLKCCKDTFFFDENQQKSCGVAVE